MDGPHGDPDGERAAARAWAAAFRDRRAELRSQLSAGTTTLAEVLERADDTDDGVLELLFVLESLPGAGKVSTRRHLARLDLAESTPLRRLTAEQRAVVLREFPVATTDTGRRVERAS